VFQLHGSKDMDLFLWIRENTPKEIAGRLNSGVIVAEPPDGPCCELRVLSEHGTKGSFSLVSSRCQLRQGPYLNLQQERPRHSALYVPALISLVPIRILFSVTSVARPCAAHFHFNSYFVCFCSLSFCTILRLFSCSRCSLSRCLRTSRSRCWSLSRTLPCYYHYRYSSDR
jgi:hypothetical protein